MGTLVLGLVGIQAELLLLEHFEGAWQYTPIVLNAIALAVLIWHGTKGSRTSVRVVQVTMLLFIASGVLGTWLHYQGNAEFELEITPTMAAWEVFKASMMGATPVLAPGTMTQLGLIGLAWSFRHPLLRA